MEYIKIPPVKELEKRLVVIKEKIENFQLNKQKENQPKNPKLG